jgi:N-carbamoyl-L-amino-acid hydrolase
MNIRVNEQRIAAELETLAGCSAGPPPGLTRIVFSDADREARQWFKQLCRDAGLTLREDAVGNTFATWLGSDPTFSVVGTGSHIDAIPNSGSYDGTVGVLGGLEAIRALQGSGFQPRRSLELLLFTSEEPTRFGIGCLGSRLLAGVLDASTADALRDRDGQTLCELRQEAGFSGDLRHVALPPNYYHAFVELHIEQGPLLEREHLDLGIVTNIAAPASLRVTIEGEGGHAGAVLMPQRHDAFLAAAELALELEASARATRAIDTVATTGVCNVFPGAVNSIPSRVRLEMDIRDTELARRDSLILSLRRACSAISVRRGVSIGIETINSDAPATCSPAIVEALEEACRTETMRYRKMVSRAYHDSLFLSRIAPVSMLFIPCRGGVSHRPDEYSSPSAIANGVHVLARALAQLAA